MDSFEDDRWSENDDEYEIGYRKPPKHSRFKKGESGNPRGKSRGTKNSATLLKQSLLASVLVKQNGHETKTTKLRVIVTRLIHQAMKGHYPSIRLLLRSAGLDRGLNEPKHERQGDYNGLDTKHEKGVKSVHDQPSTDSPTVRYPRQMHGVADWPSLAARRRMPALR